MMLRFDLADSSVCDTICEQFCMLGFTFIFGSLNEFVIPRYIYLVQLYCDQWTYGCFLWTRSFVFLFVNEHNKCLSTVHRWNWCVAFGQIEFISPICLKSSRLQFWFQLACPYSCRPIESASPA